MAPRTKRRLHEAALMHLLKDRAGKNAQRVLINGIQPVKAPGFAG